MDGVNLWQIGISIVISFIGFLVAMIGVLLKGLKESLDKQVNAQDGKIEKLSAQLSDMREKMPLQFVLRDDFVRAISGLDNRLDKGLTTISRQIQELMNQKKGG